MLFLARKEGESALAAMVDSVLMCVMIMQAFCQQMIGEWKIAAF